MTVHIGLAGQGEIPACARLIAEALQDDLVVGQIVRGEQNRLQRLTDLYTAALRTGAFPHGVIDVARSEPGGPILGVAAWESPGGSREPWRHLFEVPRYLRAIGLRNMRASLRALSTFSGHRPQGSHWYLADIVVSPKARGLGVGSAPPRSRTRTRRPPLCAVSSPPSYGPSSETIQRQ